MDRIKSFFAPDRPLSGEAYGTIGCAAFLFKFILDNSVANVFFHRSWTILDYWRVPRVNTLYLADLLQKQPAICHFASSAVDSFMAFGVAMTLRRLNSLPSTHVAVHFIFRAIQPEHFRFSPYSAF